MQLGQIVWIRAAPRPVMEVLRREAAAAQVMSGKPLAYKSQAELDAYLTSIAVASLPNTYDRDGFLPKLGITDIHSPGKQDGPTLNAILQVPNYRPGTIVDGHEILPQVMAWDVASAHPDFFLDVIKVTNVAVEEPAVDRALWKAPFQSAQQPISTGESMQMRYAGTLGKLGLPASHFGLLFDDDVHAGTPTDAQPNGSGYGTYTMAISLGFSVAQATRIATSCDGIDYDTTPYGKTSFSPTGQMDRHFNLDRSGQDTRLVWAERHLGCARDFAGMEAFDQAEIELGCGLHSLQDLFAHGQLTPSLHGVVGEFPDDVTYDPVALFEATEATKAYLKAYLAGVAPVDSAGLVPPATQNMDVVHGS